MNSINTPFGTMPSDWKLLDCGNIISFVGGNAFKSKDSTTNGVRWLKIANVGVEKAKWSEESFLPENYISEFEKYLLSSGDIVMALTRPIIGNRLKICKLRESDVPALLNQRVSKLEVINLKIHLDYYFHFMQTPYFVYSMNVEMAGTDPPNISIKSLNRIKVPVPPLPEQKKIAKILSTVDEHIDEVDKMIEDLKELKKGLMQKLLTEGIGHTEFKDSPVGRIPVEWEVEKLYNCIDEVLDYRGRTPKKLNMSWCEGGIPALSANNVKMGKVDFELPTYYGSEALYKKWMTGTKLKKGDVLMTMEAPLGNVAQVPDDGKYILSQRVIAFKTKKVILDDFLRYILMSDWFQKMLELNSTGTTAKGINQKNLSKLVIAYPTVEEQLIIVNVLKSVDIQITQYENSLSEYKELKKGLMQQLLTGKTRVKVEE